MAQSVTAVSSYASGGGRMSVFTSNDTRINETTFSGQWVAAAFLARGKALTATSWVDNSGQLHTRLFLGHENRVIEYRRDGSNDWVRGTLDVEGVSAAATSFYLSQHNQYIIRVYVRDANGQATEWWWDTPNQETWYKGWSVPGVVGEGPFAAVSWDWKLRVYVSDGTNIREHVWDSGWSLSSLSVPGTTVAATSWKEASGQIRIQLFVGDGTTFTDRLWNGTAWTDGSFNANGTSASATSYVDAAGVVHVRVYVLDADGKVMEHACDGGVWSATTLPKVFEPVSWKTQGTSLYNSLSDAPFTSRGVCYSRPLISDPNPPPDADYLRVDRAEIWRNDLTSMRAMSVNTIKIYSLNLDQLSDFPHKPFLDAAWHDGDKPIFVLLSLWIEPTALGDPGRQADVAAVRQQYLDLVNAYVAHPAVVGFSIGAEVNTDASRRYEAAFWDDFIGIARHIRAVASGKILTTGLIDGTADYIKYTQDGNVKESYVPVSEPRASVPNRAVELEYRPAALRLALVAGGADVIDVWGFDFYKLAVQFPEIFTNYRSAFTALNKPLAPLLVAEFGEPATRSGEPMSKLTSHLTAIWTAIKDSGVACGGCIFEWADEWWKENHPDGTSTETACGRTHDRSTKEMYTRDDGTVVYYDEEWFGINALNKADCGETLEPRETYTVFKALWGA